MNFSLAIGASVIVSLISLVGIFNLLLNEKLLNKILIILIGFSTGGLIGGAFLHLLPEAMEKRKNSSDIFGFVIVGFILFFILEKYLYWRHCHKGEKCDVHVGMFTYLNLIGDGIHNFIDGLVMGASFFIDIKIGITTTFAIILHEIPQELGDFGVLVYGGFNKSKALFYNFLSAITAIIGTIVGYYISNKVESITVFLLPFAAGGFIYIASCDLIPELHKQKDLKISNISIIFFILGILFMYLVK